MRISTRALYSLRATVELALRHSWVGSGAGPVRLADIAKRQDIPEDYLRQISVALRRGGIVTAVNGPKGGYMLLREPARISALEVVLAAGERLELAAPKVKPSGHGRGRACPTRLLWQRVADAIRETLGGTSIHQLAFPVSRVDPKGIPHGYMFEI